MGKSLLVQWRLVLHQTVQPGDRLQACGSAPSGRGRGDVGEKEELRKENWRRGRLDDQGGD